MKLDLKYKQIKSSLIMMKEFSTLSKVYGILVQGLVHQNILEHDNEAPV